jgi:hypothetical protein
MEFFSTSKLADSTARIPPKLIPRFSILKCAMRKYLFSSGQG